MKSDFIIENINVSNHFIKRYQERFGNSFENLVSLLADIYKEFKSPLKSGDSFNLVFCGVRIIVKNGILITII